ncbi:MAG: sulfatase [Candidatus Sulfomarinibacteraceae bacterium]
MSGSSRAGWPVRLRLTIAAVLVVGWSGCAPAPLEKTLDLAAAWPSALTVAEPHHLDLGSDGHTAFLGAGWSYGEIQRKTGDSFVWSRGASSELRFHLGWRRDLAVEICGRPFHWPNAPSQTIAFTLNGRPIGELTDLPPARRCHRLELPETAQVVGRNRLVATYGRVTRPSEVIDGSTDQRELGFAWSEVTFHGTDTQQMTSAADEVVMPAGSLADHFIELAPGAVLRVESCESLSDGASTLELTVQGADDGGETGITVRCSGEPVEMSFEQRSGLHRLRIGNRPHDPAADQPTGIRLRRPAVFEPAVDRPEAVVEPIGNGPAPRISRPNVVIYLVDALRADRLGAYGCDRGLSPRLDAMAAEGVTFTDVTAQSSWTKAAVASIFTGQWPRAHGVNGPDDRLPDHLPTLPELLRADGYRTAAVVANAYVGEPFGFARGFDSFEFLEHTKGRSDVIHERLERWFEAREDTTAPFFLYVHTIDPHAPYAPPTAFREAFAASVEDPSVGQVETVRGLVTGTVEPSAALGEDLRLLYDAEIAANDASFGRLLDLLEEVGELEDTLVIFTSDHGEAFGEHGTWTHGLDLHNEVLAVPLVMRLPGAASPGRRVTTPVQHIDLLPTILDRCGVAGAEPHPGAALLAGDRPAAVDEDRPVLAYLDYWGRTGASVLRDGWKLIQPLSADFGGRNLLFRHDVDPGETRELSADSPVRSGWLEAVLAGELQTRASGVATEVDAETKQQLEALGYLN